VEIRSQKLSDFFNIGRDRGWDIEKQRWTVHSLVNPEGLTFTLGDILPNGIPVDIRLEKSGSRYGYPPLREAIIRIQQYDLPVENVLVTSGTQHANFLALTVALNAGDEAIVEIPSWEQPRVLCEALGVRTHIVRRRPELGWKLDLNELEGLGSPRLKVIYVCNPGNPTGAVMAADELKKVCDIAARWGSYVVSDEIYRGLEWDGTLTPSVANYYERGVSTSSLSKTLGMGGLRLGWLATPDRNFIERCMELKYYISLHQQSRLDETVALAALEPATYRGLVQRSMTVGRVNYEIVSKWMASSDTFSWVAPQGGFLSFPAYRLDIPSWDLCLRLLDKPYQTYLIPGSCYEYEGHVRLGFGPGTPAETIRVGLERTSQFIADFKAGRVAA
jgi:aspartate/methionine/tyrosine aminotransferase